MIILVSGTNGSGKTYLAQRVLERVGEPISEIIGGPKQKVIGVRYTGITVFGKYGSSACGGCDSLNWKGASDTLEEAIRAERANGQKVFLEGLIVGTWGLERLKGLVPLGLNIVQLTTSLEDCIEAVNDRRRVKMGADFTPTKRDNIVAKYRTLRNALPRKVGHGIPVHKLDREAAYDFVTSQLF